MAIDDPTRRDRLERIAKVLRCSVESLMAETEPNRSLSDLLAVWPDLTEADRATIVAFAHSCAGRWTKANVA